VLQKCQTVISEDVPYIYIYILVPKHYLQSRSKRITLTGCSFRPYKLFLLVQITLYFFSCVVGYNASTVITASHKRRQKGNSDDTVMYGYESSTTLTTDRLHYKLQTRPLAREGAPRRRAKQLSGKRKEKEKSGHGPQRGVRHQDG
jgi:hypothetical protein